MRVMGCRRRVAAAAGATMVLLAACGRGEEAAGGTGSGTEAASAGAEAAGGGGTRVAAVIKGLDNPFFQAMEQGIEAGAEDAGVDIEVQAAASIDDTTGQADRLSTLAGQDFGCFVVNPISGNNLVQPLAQVGQAGTPIVNIDSPVEAEAAEAADLDIATYIGTDNTAAGALGGEHMLESVDEGAQVALIGGVAGDVTSQARLDGFLGAVEGQLEVVQTVDADWERQQALTAATDILQANPDLAGFFVANDDMGLGVSRAAQNEGVLEDLTIISVDGVEDALQAVADGQLTATVSQYPYTIGQLGVDACVAAAAGAELPEEVEAPVLLVTEENAEDAIAAFPEPFEEVDNPFADLAG